ncbi:MAG: hypothetical protein LBL13_04740 [Bacteroidales bacterium]|jgi:hypothetical protein|nr:hypothetical protein [Bacteroidales bacterium]
MDIQLLFDFRGVSQPEWEETWFKCVAISDFFPVPLAMSHTRSYKRGERQGKYYVWSDRLVLDENTKNECLALRTDYISLEWGGVFNLYRNIACYAKHPTSERNILWHDRKTEDERYYFGHIGDDSRCIWNNGTGGAPYSLAVLALGIYLESRFPENCFMHGDYSEYQIERMRLWLGGVLQEPIPVPLCNAPDRLFDRLLPLYPNADSLVRRFLELSKLNLCNSFTFLIEKGCHEALQKELIGKLKDYNSPLQWGASDLLLPYLKATCDVEAVVALVQKVQKERDCENFSLTDLLELLIDKGITINPYDAGSETVREWNKTGEGLTTTIKNLNHIFLRMSGFLDKTDCYLSADKLLEIFACTEPANGINFQKIIEERAEKVFENYKKLEEATETISKQRTSYNKMTSYFTNKAQWIRKYGLPSEEYILMEVEKQCFTLHKPEEGALRIAKHLGRNQFLYEQKTGKPFFEASQQKAVNDIVMFTSNRFSLRETAWQSIENEKDMDILTMLLFYACIEKNELHFSQWRRFIFESPELWTEMKKAYLEGKHISLPDEDGKGRKSQKRE